MPTFIASGLTVIQLQSGEISTGGGVPTGGSSSFRYASPDLYYRLTPFGPGHVYELGRPWPMSFFTNDNGALNFSVIGPRADEWRAFQFGPINFISGGIGTADIIEANDTLGATGALLIVGTASIIEAGDTVSSTATLLISGALAATEAGDTLSGTGKLAIGGTLSATEAGDTLAGTGVLPIVGTLSITEAGDTLVATGSVGFGGTLSVTEASDTLSAIGALRITGTVAVVEQNDTGTGASAIAIAGTLAATEADDTLAASALMPIFYPRRGGIDERQEFERRQQEWQENLRRIIDRSFRIADGEIDPITFEEIPPPDFSAINAALAAQEMALDRQRIETFMAAEQRRQQDDAIAVLLLAA